MFDCHQGYLLQLLLSQKEWGVGVESHLNGPFLKWLWLNSEAILKKLFDVNLSLSFEPKLTFSIFKHQLSSKFIKLAK
jgi:hypothetical protein